MMRAQLVAPVRVLPLPQNQGSTPDGVNVVIGERAGLALLPAAPRTALGGIVENNQVADLQADGDLQQAAAQ